MPAVDVMRHAARASRNAGSVDVVGRSLGVHKSQPSRWNRGATRGVFYETFVEVARRLEDGGADPFPMVAEAMAMRLISEILTSHTDREIIVGYYKQRDVVVPQKEIDEQVASRSNNAERYEEALMASASARLRLAAYLAAARARKLDLNRYDKHGNVLIRPVRQ